MVLLTPTRRAMTKRHGLHPAKRESSANDAGVGSICKETSAVPAIIFVAWRAKCRFVRQPVRPMAVATRDSL
jgi:hypothetical protein